MRILIATDGTLPVADTVAHVERMYEPGDTVIVMIAINFPRRLINQLKMAATSADGPKIEDVVEAAGPGHGGIAGGDRVAARLAGKRGEGWPPVEEFLERYRAELSQTATQPMVDGLRAAGVEADTLVRETEERTAATIMEACRERKVDLLVMGSTGRGRFEGFVGSTGTKLVRHAPCDVLMVRVAVSR